MLLAAIAILLLAASVAGLVLVMLRTFRNVGPLSLEETARRDDLLYVPISRALAAQLVEWSQPLRMRFEQHGHPLLGQFVFEFPKSPESEADEGLEPIETVTEWAP